MFKRVSNWKNYLNKILYICTARQKVLLAGMVILALFCAFLQLIGVYIISPFVSAMTNEQEFLENAIIRMLSNATNIHDFKMLFLVTCITVAVIYAIKEIASVFQLWYSAKFGAKVQRELSERVLDNYMYRDYDFFTSYGTSQILRDVTVDVNSVYIILTCFSAFFTELVTIIMIIVYMIISDWRMSLVVGGLALGCILVMYKYFKNITRKNGEETRRRNAENRKVLLDAIGGIKEIQVMKKQDFFYEKYSDTLKKIQHPQIVQVIATGAPTYVIEGVFVVGIMVYICISTAIDSSYLDKLPILASLLVGAIRLLPSMGRVSNNLNNINYNLSGLNSIYNILNTQSKAESVKVNSKDSGNNIVFKEKLELVNISWKYADGQKKIFDLLNFTINKGESVGIIGQSGSGKSTLADIILALHVPQSGRIVLDGVDITSIPFEYSRVIGYVPQTVYLTDGSIRENVAFGTAMEAIDDEKVWNALKQAQLEDFVKGTEKRLDTIIGERGIKFSGGQRQRLAIARALYREPQILILDEATSALDNDTEKELMNEIENMYGRLTMIIIAHRLTTVRKCDKIFEIVDGKITERDKTLISFQ